MKYSDGKRLNIERISESVWLNLSRRNFQISVDDSQIINYQNIISPSDFFPQFNSCFRIASSKSLKVFKILLFIHSISSSRNYFSNFNLQQKVFLYFSISFTFFYFTFRRDDGKAKSIQQQHTAHMVAVEMCVMYVSQ